MYKSKCDLAIVISSLSIALLLNVAKLVPSIMYFTIPYICQVEYWSIVHTCIFGINSFTTLMYVTYLLIVPYDRYRSIIVSKVLGAIGVPYIIIDMGIASLSLPGCIYGIHELVTTSYTCGIISSAMGIIYYVSTGIYNIYRWRSGL